MLEIEQPVQTLAPERDPLTERILGACIEVHRVLGPGLLESAYENCLCHELRLREIAFRRQVALPVNYKGVKLDCGYAADIIVENEVILELKAVEKIAAVHEAQLLTYMKLSGMRKGLLLNFNVTMVKDGVRRRVL